MPNFSSPCRLVAVLALVTLLSLMVVPAWAQGPAAPGLPQAGWLAPLVRAVTAWLAMVQPGGGPFDNLGCTAEPNGEPLCAPSTGLATQPGGGPVDNIGCTMEPNGAPLCAPSTGLAQPGGGPFDNLGCTMEPSGEPLCEPSE